MLLLKAARDETNYARSVSHVSLRDKYSPKFSPMHSHSFRQGIKLTPQHRISLLSLRGTRAKIFLLANYRDYLCQYAVSMSLYVA